MVVMISDADILQRFKIDRKQGIQVLFRRYYRPLVLFADEFVHSLSTAEDIVQDFFIRLWTDDYLEKLLPSALSSYLLPLSATSESISKAVSTAIFASEGRFLR